MHSVANISIDDLARLIANDLAEYSEEVDDAVEKVITKTTKEALTVLKNNNNIPKMTGKYKKSFYAKDLYKSKGKNEGYFKMVVANRKYQLTHLLENGHVNRDGSRTKAYPHWKDAQAIADTLPDRIKGAIEK